MDNIDMSTEAITFRLKKVSQLRKLCVALKNGGKEKQPIEKIKSSSDKKPVEYGNRFN
jgi:hypothetical protein